MVDNKIFYERLVELKEMSGKSFNQIERELGYPRNSLANYKFGRVPSATRLIEISNFFEVSPKYLLNEPESEIKNISMKMFFKNLNLVQKKELAIIVQKWVLTSVKKSH
jgi:transcriptional regulator with XRE-family HTH domain